MNDAGRSDDVLASLERRFVAAVLDLLLLLVAIAPGMAVMALVDPRRGNLLANAAAFGILLLQWSLLCQTGQSFGKRFLGVKVVRVDGRPVDKVSGVAMRTYWLVILLEWKYGLLVWVVDVLPIFGAQRRCIHDLTAGTKVIRVPIP